MKKVLIDTSGWFASLVANDTHHPRASALLRRAQPERWTLITSNVVVFETHTLLLNRTHGSRAAALAFLDYMETGAVKVVRVLESDERRAIKIVRQHDDKDFSMFDALSFAMMERLHIRDALSFDRDFLQFGRVNVL